MAEAPHGTAPALEGKDLANPMAMILAAAALLHYARRRRPRPPRAPSTTPSSRRSATGSRTPDLGGHATTTGFTDAVIERLRERG